MRKTIGVRILLPGVLAGALLILGACSSRCWQPDKTITKIPGEIVLSLDTVQVKFKLPSDRSWSDPEWLRTGADESELKEWRAWLSHGFLEEPAVVTFLAIEHLDIVSTWHGNASVVVRLPAGQSVWDAVDRWPEEYHDTVERVELLYYREPSMIYYPAQYD